MARTNNLSNFLTDVAGAIKEKIGDSTAIPASEFDTKIQSIETKEVYQSKSVNITTNGNYTVVPDTGYGALSQVGLSVSVPGQIINNQNKTITENGSYTADAGYTGLGTVIVNVPQGSGQTQLVYEKETTVEKCEGATYGFTLNTSTNKYTYSSNNTTVAASRFWFWSNGITPFAITGTCSYPNDSKLYTVLSKVDTPIDLTRTYAGDDVFTYYSASYETKQINANYGVLPAGIHYVDIKHYNQWSEDSSSTTSIDNIFPAIDKTITVYATKTFAEMQTLSPLTDDICVVHDKENLVYGYDGTNWNRITAPNDMIRLFSSKNEMNNTTGLVGENAVVYGEDWSNFVKPTSSTTEYQDVAFKVTGTYQYTGEDTPTPMSLSTADNNKRYILWAYGDTDEWGELWEYEEYAPTTPNTMNLLVINDGSVERVIHYVSVDGINYTTSDLQEPFVVEQVGVSSSIDDYKITMLLGKAPAFYGLYVYEDRKNPEYCEGIIPDYTSTTYTMTSKYTRKALELMHNYVENVDPDLMQNSNMLTTTVDGEIFDIYLWYVKASDPTSTSKNYNYSQVFVNSSNEIYLRAYMLTQGETTSYDLSKMYITKVTVNTQTEQVTKVEIEANTQNSPMVYNSNNYTVYYGYQLPTNSWITRVYFRESDWTNEGRSSESFTIWRDDSNNPRTVVTCAVPRITMWYYAKTQLSALQISDLYNGITAYGHEGIVTGDTSWENNITEMKQLQLYMPNVITSTTYGISNMGKQCLFGDTTTTTKGYDNVPTRSTTKYITEDNNITNNHILLAKMNNVFETGVAYSPDGKWKIQASDTSTVLTITITNTETNVSNTHTITKTSNMYMYCYNYHINNDMVAVVYSTGSGTMGMSRIMFSTNTLTSTSLSHNFGTSAYSPRIYYHKRYNTFYITLEYSASSAYGAALFRVVDNGTTLSGSRLFSNTWSNTFGDNVVRFSPDGTVYYFYGNIDKSWGKKLNGSTGATITSYTWNDHRIILNEERPTLYSLPRILENNDGFVIGSNLYSKSTGDWIDNTNNYYYPNVTDLDEHYGVELDCYGLPNDDHEDEWTNGDCIIYDCATDTKYTIYANICLPIGVKNNVLYTGGETIECVSTTNRVEIIFANSTNGHNFEAMRGISATLTTASVGTYDTANYLITPSAVFRNGLYSQYLISPVNNSDSEYAANLALSEEILGEEV